FLVGVDRHERLCAFDSGHVLDRSGDSAGDVDVGGDAAAGLADLLGVRPPTQSRDNSGDAQGTAEVVDEFEDLGETVLRTDSAPGTDYGPGRGQSGRIIGGLDLGALDTGGQVCLGDGEFVVIDLGGGRGCLFRSAGVAGGRVQLQIPVDAEVFQDVADVALQ